MSKIRIHKLATGCLWLNNSIIIIITSSITMHDYIYAVNILLGTLNMTFSNAMSFKP